MPFFDKMTNESVNDGALDLPIGATVKEGAVKLTSTQHFTCRFSKTFEKKEQSVNAIRIQIVMVDTRQMWATETTAIYGGSAIYGGELGGC
jgi:hypothetical protein